MKTNLVDVQYHATGKSTNTNEMGMRAMQARAFEKRNSQYLLVKAPPASGKSRALMFIALDKLINQRLSKVIVAVPEKTIGASFKNTDLQKYGFFADWRVESKNNLTLQGGQVRKTQAFIDFLKSDDQVIIMTHATLRFAYERIADDHVFDNVFLAIDEFHHVSASDNSVLGGALSNIIRNSSAHVMAMTGSYFRGDSVPILDPADEAMFDKVTYSYYEQLDGYKYLKSFGIGYHFYQGKYYEAIEDVLDTTKKTIIHIPNVNSSESTKQKYNEVDEILDIIGNVEGQDEETGFLLVRDKKTNNILKIADLVTETGRDTVQTALGKIESVDELDIVIALGMAKEGFDWPFAEYALTVGYRGSLTEIVQIIGRVTRDSPNKTHSQFTNLLQQPAAADDEVTYTVNNMLKAITASLLMEQVLAPEYNLKPKRSPKDKNKGNHENGDIFVGDLKVPGTQRVKDILTSDMTELKEAILTDADVQATFKAETDPAVVNKILIPKVILTKYPDLDKNELETVRQHMVASLNLPHATFETTEDSAGGSIEFIKMGSKFVNIEELDINLIDSINPFQNAFEVISRDVDVPTLKIIQRTIDANKYDFDDNELVILLDQIVEFSQNNGREPDKNSTDELERRYAFALSALRERKAKVARNNG
ncbi:DEAD/DEAH box helicase [Weissella cibaria]|uniref:DEAD/DEAH box helicase n=1 Tax=Weissella cibaria TaxID=137591 RepID=UPI001FF54E2D|nr:DEAD/DEAH box helicase [Weissella cibaria]UOX37615.1 ATP-dependent helicase [Weissella cibaria]